MSIKSFLDKYFGAGPLVINSIDTIPDIYLHISRMNSCGFDIYKEFANYLNSLDINILRDIEDPIFAIEALGYTSIPADQIPDNNNMWKVGYIAPDGEKFIDYTDDPEPHALIRRIYLKLLDYHFEKGFNEQRTIGYRT